MRTCPCHFCVRCNVHACSNVSVFVFISLPPEPNHERALSNMAYFNRLKDDKPDEFIDQEIPIYEHDRLEMSEREIYEATCREGRPYVSVWAHRRDTCPSIVGVWVLIGSLFRGIFKAAWGVKVVSQVSETTCRKKKERACHRVKLGRSFPLGLS